MADDFLTPGRTKSLRRLLAVVLGFAVLLVVLSVPLALGDDYRRFGILVLCLGLAMGALSWQARAAVHAGSPRARRLTILTAVATLVFSVPLIGLVYLGLLTAVTAVGLLFTIFAADGETQ